MSSSTLNPAGHFVLGTACDMFAILGTQPLDTLQTFIMSGKGLPPFTHLWKGSAANCSGAIVMGGLPFLVNGTLVQYVSKGEKLSSTKQLGMSLTIAFPTSVAVAPFERVAKIHQLLGGSVLQAYKTAAQSRSFFKAIAPVFFRDSKVFGTFFGLRKVFENNLTEVVQEEWQRKNLAAISTGAIAGFLSTPAARVNVLMQGDLKNTYPSMLKTCQMIIKKEGLTGLFKGGCSRTPFLGVYYFFLGIGERHIPKYFPQCFHV